MLLRRHKEASVKAPTSVKEPDFLEDDKKGLEDPAGTGDPGQDGNFDPENVNLGVLGNTDLSNQTDYEKMSYEDLKALVKEKNLPCASVKKVDLIEALKASK